MAVPPELVRAWEEQRRAAVASTQAPPTQAPKIRNRGGFLSSLISEVGGAGGAAAGAAAGTALLPGIGTILGGLIGGFAGGTGGKAIEQKVRDDQNFTGAGGSARSAFGEGALSGVLGAGGEVLNVLKAGKAATGVKGLKNIGTNLKAGAAALGDTQAASRLTKAGAALKKAGTGAVDVNEGFRAIPNAEARLATIDKYGISSGRKGLEDGAKIMAKLEGDLQPILKSTKVPVKDTSTVLDKILKTTSADVTDGALNRTILSQKKAIANAAKDGVISADELRAIRSKLGDGIFSGAETASKDLKKEIYKAYGDVIGKRAPTAKAILGEQHNLLDLEKGLSKRAVGARVPLFGTGFQSPTIGRIRDAGIDSVSSALGKAGAVTGNPVGRNLMYRAPFALSNALGGQSGEAPAGMNQDVVDPMQSFDVTPPPQAPVQQYGLREALMDAQSLLGTKQSPATYLTYAKELMDQHKTTGNGGNPNITKVTAQQYGLAQRGSQSLEQLANLLQSDPKVLNRTATPGRKLPVVGGFISNAAGTGDFDAIGYNIASSLLRLETGAQANESEIRNLQSQLMPRAGDSKQTVARKLQQLNQAFNTYLNAAGVPEQGQLAGALQ